jgi:hypothetical protein
MRLWTIGARALANSPSANRPCHFDRSGPTLFPTFAPAKVSAHAGEKSLFDRPRRPLLPQCNDSTQLLKCRKFALYGALNLPIFSMFRLLLNLRLSRKTALLIINNLQPLFARSLSLFAPLILCFQPLVGSSGKNTGGGRGYGLSKKRGALQGQFNGRRLAASPRAPWHHSRRSARQCTPAETRSTARSPSCP